jgi:hypothetical protein
LLAASTNFIVHKFENLCINEPIETLNSIAKAVNSQHFPNFNIFNITESDTTENGSVDSTAVNSDSVKTKIVERTHDLAVQLNTIVKKMLDLQTDISKISLTTTTTTEMNDSNQNNNLTNQVIEKKNPTSEWLKTHLRDLYLGSSICDLLGVRLFYSLEIHFEYGNEAVDKIDLTGHIRWRVLNAMSTNRDHNVAFLSRCWTWIHEDYEADEIFEGYFDKIKGFFFFFLFKKINNKKN